MTCPYAENWKNREGWLVLDNGKLVCLDWDDFCTECRTNDSSDVKFEVSCNKTKKESI